MSAREKSDLPEVAGNVPGGMSQLLQTGSCTPRQTFVRRCHRPTISTSSCSSMVAPSANATAAGARREAHRAKQGSVG